MQLAVLISLTQSVGIFEYCFIQTTYIHLGFSCKYFFIFQKCCIFDLFVFLCIHKWIKRDISDQPTHTGSHAVFYLFSCKLISFKSKTLLFMLQHTDRTEKYIFKYKFQVLLVFLSIQNTRIYTYIHEKPINSQ